MIRTVFAAAGLTLALAEVPMPAEAQDGHGAPATAAHAAGHDHHHAAFESDRLHVRVDGEGRDIILIPGLSSSPQVWQGTVDHLGSGWRVHRVHIQGFAGAPAKGNAEGPVAAPVAEEIARYIAENNLNKPVVVGHSMGGTIGMMLAARHPEAVGKLMVVDMVPFMGAMFAQPGTEPTVAAVTPMADMIHQGMANSPRAQYQAQADAQIAGMISNESLRAGPLQDSRSSDQKVSAAAFRELIVTDLRPELGRITAPTKVLYVKFNDPRMTAEMADGIYRASFAAMPGASLKRIDDAAHFLFLDQPETFYRELDAFLSAE